MPKNKPSERGLALIITLLITAILVTVIIEIVSAVHLHMFMTGSFKDGQRAAILAEGGVELAASSIAELTKDKNYTFITPEDAGRVIPEGEGILNLRVEDEQAKFPVNLIVYANGETNAENYAAYARLLNILKLKEELADTLADWIDINDEPRSKGAETHDFYGTLSSPYTAKNGPLDSINEVLLVKGYTPEVSAALFPFITVYTDGRININTAPKEVIMALSADITGEMAQRVIDYREKEPFTDTADIRRVVGFETIGFGLQGRITVKSGVFRIFSRGSIGETVRDVEAVVDLKSGRKIDYWRQR